MCSPSTLSLVVIESLTAITVSLVRSTFVGHERVRLQAAAHLFLSSWDCHICTGRWMYNAVGETHAHIYYHTALQQ